MGGAQLVIVQLAHWLEKLGHNAYILTTLVDYTNMPEFARNLNYIEADMSLLKKEGAVYTLIDNRFLLCLQMLAFGREIRRVVEEKEIDVVNTHHPPFHWVANFMPVPVVWTCHEPISLWISDKPYFALTKRKPIGLQKVVQYFYEGMDRVLTARSVTEIVAVSERTKWDILEIYNRDALVVPSAVSMAFFRADGKVQDVIDRYGLGDSFVLLQVGHFRPEKNHVCSVEILDILKDKIANLKLVFVGAGPLQEHIEREVARRQLEKGVIFTGRVDAEELRQIYCSSDVLISPAMNQSWGLTPFEALAAGTIPVMSTECGASEVLAKEDIGFVAEPIPEAFAERIMYVYQNQEIVVDKICRGRAYIAANLNYEAYAKNMLRIFESCRKIGKRA
jgi:glycosyltransferase involved in cell wall biosynthesis